MLNIEDRKQCNVILNQLLEVMYGYYEYLAERAVRTYDDLLNRRRRGAIAVRRLVYNSNFYRHYFETEEPLQIY